MKVAVTGSSGFVGRAFVSLLKDLSVDHVCINRVKEDSPYCLGPKNFCLDYDDNQALVLALTGVDVVFHLAGRAHKRISTSEHEYIKFKIANVDCLRSVIHASVEAKVKRIVFMSSIGVLGSSSGFCSFSDSSPVCPSAIYSQSKLEAEQLLVSLLSERNDIDWVILRPPLVYGLNCPGNMAKLIRLIKAFPVVPFGSVYSRKSFISLNNLVSILILCLDHPGVSRRTFVVSDCDDISVTEMFACLLSGLGLSRRRLIRFPECILDFLFKLSGLSRLYQQVTSDLLIDSKDFVNATGWTPVTSCRSELKLTAMSFRGKI